jgi:fructokinase
MAMGGMQGLRIGIDLGGTKIEAIALDAAGQELARRRRPTPRGDYDGTVRTMVDLVRDINQALGRPGAAACRVGIGIPGSVWADKGLVRKANPTWINGRPLGPDVAAVLGCPVRLDNDANCFAVSEAADGAAAGAAVVFGVIIGTGVGGGVVVRGWPISGANAIAGEWGHNPLPWMKDEERPGFPCYCGQKGCIETFLSGGSFARDHKLATGEELSAPEITARAEAGEPRARASLDRYVERLARSLATVVNLIDPDVIVLGGGMSNTAALYREVPELLPRYVFSGEASNRIVPPKHGDSSGVRGAAWLWPAQEETR